MKKLIPKKSPPVLKKCNNGYLFYCPGCNALHYIDKSYNLSGGLSRPTFRWCGKILSNKPNISWEYRYDCSFSIIDGKIYYNSIDPGDKTNRVYGNVPMVPTKDWKKRIKDGTIQR